MHWQNFIFHVNHLLTNREKQYFFIRSIERDFSFQEKYLLEEKHIIHS